MAEEMTEFEKDPQLLALFEQANREHEPNGFIDDTLALTDRRSRRNRWRWIAIGATVVLLEVFLLEWAAEFSELLSTSLIDLGEGTMAQLMQPVNSVAGLLAILLLSAHHFMRRFLHR